MIKLSRRRARGLATSPAPAPAPSAAARNGGELPREPAGPTMRPCDKSDHQGRVTDREHRGMESLPGVEKAGEERAKRACVTSVRVGVVIDIGRLRLRASR